MDLSSFTRTIAALAFVLALIGLCTWAARRFGLMARITVDRKNKARRLHMVDVLNIDARRRLVLLRRDDVEHLVLFNADKDTVIETGILPPKGATPGDGAP